MTKDEALRLALEALENSVDLVREDAYNAEELYGNYPARQGKVRGLKVLADDHEKAITAIKAALEAKDEPVAWLCGRSNGDLFALTVGQLDELGYGNISMKPFEKLAPLYTTTPQRTWVGLTAEEREQVQAESYGKVPHHVALIAAVEAKLKEKNT